MRSTSAPELADRRPRQRRQTCWPATRPDRPVGASGRWYTGPSWATVRGGTSTTTVAVEVITSRPVSVTSPITSACTSHFAQTARKASTLSGVTTAHIRSCDSLDRISAGVMSVGPQRHRVEPDVHPAVTGRCEFRGGAGQSGAAEILDADHQVGARTPRECTRSAPSRRTGRRPARSAASLRPAAVSSPLNVSEASTRDPADAVEAGAREPYRMTLLPTPDACAVYMSAARSTPMQAALTSGLPANDASKNTSPPMLGSPRQFP